MNRWLIVCCGAWLLSALMISVVRGAAPSLTPAATDCQTTVPERPMASPAKSTLITRVDWAPQETIIRRARGGDNWPLTWADDDHLYTAYGDGNGFEPFISEKLSLGFASIEGPPENFLGINIRTPTLEQKGDGKAGRKASGILMVDGVLYLWARNAGDSQLAWSADHGQTWTWCNWNLAPSFGCPTFLNFGPNHQRRL